MKRFTIPVFCALMFVFLAVTCKKDEAKNGPATKSSQLSAVDWIMTGNIVTTGSVTNDVFANYPACAKDDLYKFSSDKLFIRKSGAVKCNVTEPDLLPSGTWFLSSGDAKISLVSLSNDTLTYDLEAISSTALTVSNTQLDNGISITTKLTYAAK